MNFSKLAWKIVLTLIGIIVIAFITDYILLFMYREDARVQNYTGGYYLSTMSADPNALATGQGELYKNEDINKEFKTFAKATFLRYTSKESDIQEQCLDTGTECTITFKVGKFFIRDIEVKNKIIYQGEQKGVVLDINYNYSPRVLFMLPEGTTGNLPIGVSRKYRIVGS